MDRGLFESLRELRRSIAAARDLPAYLVLGDATLRELARVRPGSLQSFIDIRGIGQRKVAELGPRFVEHVTAYCRQHGLQTDVCPGSRPRSLKPKKSTRGSRGKAFEMFARGLSLEHVAHKLARAHSTTVQYLVDYIQTHKPERIDAWVDEPTYRRIAQAAAELGTARLAPLREKLGQDFSYDTLRLVACHLETRE